MNNKRLLEIIALGESTTTEFKRKSTSPEKLSKEFCAFANTIGGYLIVGIDDDGSIVGVKSEKSEIDIIEKSCQFFITPEIKPIIEVNCINNKDIIVVRIEQSPLKPHKIISLEKETNKTVYQAYIRIGEKSVEASKEMTRLLAYQNPDSKPLKLSIGNSEKRLFEYLEKYETITLKEYAKLVNISDRRAARILIQLVRSGVIQIHNDSTRDIYSLVNSIK